MPKSLPNRPDITDYDFDPPLTEIGLKKLINKII